MSLRFIDALLCSLAAASTLTAQVTVRASANTDLSLEATAGNTRVTDSRSAGTDLPNGLHMRVEAIGGTPAGSLRSSSELQLSWSTTSERLQVDLVQNARGGFNIHGNQASAVFGGHEIELLFRSPIPITANLRLETCGNASTQIAGGSSEASMNGSVALGTQFSNQFWGCFPGTFAQSIDRPLQLGPGGVRVLVRASGWGTGSLRAGQGTSRLNWRFTLTPDPDFPCRITSYGTSCGADLTATPDLLLPSLHRLTLTDHSRPVAAWIAVGTSRANLPFYGCQLLTNSVLYVPWDIDAQGSATVWLAPPPIPGVRAWFQAATLGGNTVHMSNGLEFVCR